jgi:hypothetical protein
LLQGCHSQLVDKLQDDNKLLEQLVTRLLSSTTLWQVVNKLLNTCQQAWNKQCEHILLTSCWNSIATSLLQFVTTCAFLHVKICSQQACSKLVNKLFQCCYFIKLLQGCHSRTHPFENVTHTFWSW